MCRYDACSPPELVIMARNNKLRQRLPSPPPLLAVRNLYSKHSNCSPRKRNKIDLLLRSPCMVRGDRERESSQVAYRNPRADKKLRAKKTGKKLLSTWEKYTEYHMRSSCSTITNTKICFEQRGCRVTQYAGSTDLFGDQTAWTEKQSVKMSSRPCGTPHVVVKQQQRSDAVRASTVNSFVLEQK